MGPQILSSSPAASIVKAILPLPVTINEARSSVLNVVRVFAVALLLVVALSVIAQAFFFFAFKFIVCSLDYWTHYERSYMCGMMFIADLWVEEGKLYIELCNVIGVAFAMGERGCGLESNRAKLLTWRLPTKVGLQGV